MEGLDAFTGVDRVATMASRNSQKTSAYEEEIWRSIISGSVPFGDRLHTAAFDDTPPCSFA
eukprot:5844282-Karenia_brevis.AAC.1